MKKGKRGETCWGKWALKESGGRDRWILLYYYINKLLLNAISLPPNQPLALKSHISHFSLSKFLFAILESETKAKAKTKTQIFIRRNKRIYIL